MQNIQIAYKQSPLPDILKGCPVWTIPTFWTSSSIAMFMLIPSATIASLVSIAAAAVRRTHTTPPVLFAVCTSWVVSFIVSASKRQS